MTNNELFPSAIGLLDPKKVQKVFKASGDINILTPGFFRKGSETLEEASAAADERLIKYLSKIKKTTRILIINSGYGDTAVKIAETYGCKIDCLNHFTGQNKFLKDRIKGTEIEPLITISKRDAEVMPFTRETFDYVISQSDFMYEMNKKQTFRELGRIMKPEARFVFTGILKNQFCPDSVLEKINTYTDSAEPETGANYRNFTQRADLEKVFMKKTPQILLTYFEKLAERVEQPDFGKETSKAFQTELSDRISVWSDAVEAGHLNYALCLFQKRNS